MANNFILADAAANAAADAAATLCNSGTINIYSGTQPSTADTAVTTQTLLAVCTFGSTAFGSASGGVATANAITKDSSANATGTAAWFRVLKSDGSTAVFDGSVGTSDADCIVATTSVVSAAEFAITSMTYTQPQSA
jgi:hypothetical protein